MTPGSDSEQQRWSSIFAGETYYYGHAPGPVARRAVRYHEPVRSAAARMDGVSQRIPAPTALDAGCGEGQDLAFLAELGYRALGLDFTREGVAKTGRMLQSRNLKADVALADLRAWRPAQTYDLVVAVNSLQFLGESALPGLERVASAVAPRGILGLSMFGRENDRPALQGEVYFTTLAEVMELLNPDPLQRRWQMLETAQLWQWDQRTNEAQPFITLIARRI